jgi:predicted dehydrogenase
MAIEILLVGAGKMAIDYARVLTALDVRQIVLGRGAASAEAFKAATGIEPSQGALADQLQALPRVPDTAIVTVNAMYLAEVTAQLVKAGVRRILVEKPAALDLAEMATLVSAVGDAEVYVGYNRRFMASTLRAAEIVAADGGVLSVKFDFSEPSRRIAQIAKPQRELDTWFYGNSSHVIDLAFHFFGAPVALQGAVAGAVSWHPAAGMFAGHARNAQDAVMSWHANWLAPGRWGMEVMTAENRLIFQPLEKLRVQSHRSFDEVAEVLDDALDTAFKPGLMRQVRAFLYGEMADRLPSLQAHATAMQYYDVVRRGGML